MSTPGNQPSSKLAWFLTVLLILVGAMQILLNFVYNRGSTPPALIVFNGLLTIITYALALFQIFPGGLPAFLKLLPIPGLATFLRRRAPVIVLSLILIFSLTLNIYLVLSKTGTKPAPSNQASTTPTNQASTILGIHSFTDNFNASVLDKNKWRPSQKGGATLILSGGQLIDTPAKNAKSHAYIASAKLYDAREESACIEVVQVASGNSVDTAFALQDFSGNDQIQIYYENGNLIVDYNTPTKDTILYNIP
jgi:hypothetical protein